MSFFQLSLLWPLLYFANIGINITAVVILLKERHLAAWLMLLGSLFVLPSFIIYLGNLLSATGLMGSNVSKNLLQWSPLAETLYALPGLGAFIFAIGLLLHAL